MSMDMMEGESRVKDYGLERLIMLTDGVFAIAITLLAIELAPPEHWDRTFASLLHGMGRELFAYGLSFMVIAIYWASHRRTFQRFLRSDFGLTTFNLILLGLVTLLPFASRLIAEAGPRGEPFFIYLGLIAAIGVTNALMWGYAAFVGKLIDPRMPANLRLMIFLVLLIAPTVMGAGGLMLGDGSRWWMGLFGFALALPVIWLRRRMARQAGM
ncbi:MAG: DUF1211 domain-containing protein [Caulobacter sp.]|nr:DUF1211 domain-containing protein [Caulobacter sp.]